MTGSTDTLFLTAAGPRIGLGHVKRCLALADALRELGARLRIAVAGGGGWLQQGGSAWPDVEAMEWTREPELAADLVARLRPEAVVVDSYDATPDLLGGLRARGAYLVVIDDLGDRFLPADLVVNGALHATAIPYRGLPESEFLLGPRFLLLDPGFESLHRRRPAGAVERVLVTLGGDEVGGVMGETIAAVCRALRETVVEVVVGPFSAAPEPDGERMRIHRGPRSLRDLIVRADITVTAAGTTVYECLAAGTPAVAVCVADNQRPNYRALEAAALVVPGEGRVEAAVAALAMDAGLRERLSARGREVVDGRGARRVAAHIARIALRERLGSG